MRSTSVGLFLSDEEGNEVLLPNKYVPESYKIDEYIDVFVYLDSQERIVATTLTPLIKLNQFAFLKANHPSDYGTFVDWGLEKDLLIPFRNQAQPMQVGKTYLVYLYLDEETDRLVGSTYQNRFLSPIPETLNEGDEVEAIISSKTEIGWNCIVNHQFAALIYQNEVYKSIDLGQTVTAYIKKIREDGKVDLSMQKLGYESIEPLSIKIIDLLVRSHGYLPLTDKSDAEQIKKRLQMSKKSFKKAIGNLYKQHIINIQDDGIYLID
ncbi:MAG: GntR family transcriptional regulator [Bacteroidales bacterium]|nr:GntR family transcriptional regulator [Bacteroidales bacterium]